MGKKRDGRDEEKNEAVLGRNGFGDSERGQGFAGAAGHDELASVGFFKAFEDGGQGGFLVRQKIFLISSGGFFGFVDAFPFHRACGQSIHADSLARDDLADDGFFGVGRPFVRSGNNQAVGKMLFAAFAEAFAGIREKGINVGFLKIVMRFVKLALNGPKIAAATLLGNEINAGVLAVSIRPFAPAPDFGEKVFVMGVLPKKGFGDFFEAISALPVAERFFSDFSGGFRQVHIDLSGLQFLAASGIVAAYFARSCFFRATKTWTKLGRKSGMKANYL